MNRLHSSKIRKGFSPKRNSWQEEQQIHLQQDAEDWKSFHNVSFKKKGFSSPQNSPQRVLFCEVKTLMERKETPTIMQHFPRVERKNSL